MTAASLTPQTDAWRRRGALQKIAGRRIGAPLTRLAELGHYPQLEDPAVVANVVSGVLDAA